MNVLELRRNPHSNMDGAHIVAKNNQSLAVSHMQVWGQNKCRTIGFTKPGKGAFGRTIFRRFILFLGSHDAGSEYNKMPIAKGKGGEAFRYVRSPQRVEMPNKKRNQCPLGQAHPVLY
jgi:hypothetical protein